MKAITVEPHKPETARLEDIPEPDARDGSVLVEAIAVGRLRDRRRDRRGQVRVGAARQDPPGARARVARPGARSGPERRAYKKGDLVVGIVRRPDPVPCPNCAVGEWDMCRNGQYTERGIKQIDGFMSERWRIEPEYAMKVDRSLGLLGVLLEPTTVVAKAWEQVRRSASARSGSREPCSSPARGPIGLLAALVGKQRGLDVHVLDRVESGPKPELVRALGATYHTGSATGVGFEPDVIIECTGVGQVIVDSLHAVAPGGIVCLTGVGSGGRTAGLPAADVAATMVLQNNVVVGSVNANKRHWYKAGQVLARADRAWLARLDHAA